MRSRPSRVLLPFRFATGAVKKAWTAWREQRLDLSPAMVAIHLRNYYAETLQRQIELQSRSVDRAAPARRATAPAAARSRAHRFLIVSDAVPTPDRDSGSFRMFQMLILLRDMGHEVTLVADRSDADAQHVRAVEALGISIVYGTAAATAHLESEGAGYSWVLLSRPEIAFRYLFRVREHAVHARVAYDTVDLHWVRSTRGAEISGDETLRVRAASYRRLESFNVQSADVVIAISDTDRLMILDEFPSARVEVIPNIHPVVPSRTDPTGRKDLMFIGSFWHAPNEDAVCYFVEQVLPLIRLQLPDVRLLVAGSYMTGRITSLASPAVCPLGFVADAAPLFDACRVFVAPLRYGAGMKGKIGHSMSHGLPVVTTTVGAEGLALTHGVDALLADSADAFAEAVVRLYVDDDLWRRMAHASVAHVRRHFSERAARERLERIFPSDAERAPLAGAS
jgi:glycosyltransferase involved in cell wall biosynthesis